MFILAAFQMHVAVNAAFYNCEGKQQVNILESGKKYYRSLKSH